MRAHGVHAQLLAGNHGGALPVALVGVGTADAVGPLSEDPLGNLGVLILPSLILGTALAAATMRMTRTMMLEVLRQDYVRTAWAKGLRERVVIRSTEPGRTPAGLIGSPPAGDRPVGPDLLSRLLFGARISLVVGDHAECGGRHPDRRHVRIPRG